MLGRNVPILSTTQSLLWDAVTIHSDPTGQAAPKPIRGKRGGRVALFLGGLVAVEDFNAAHLARTLEVFRADYRRHHAFLETLQGQAAAAYFEAMQRFTGATCGALLGRRDDDASRAVLPAEYSDERWRVPRSSLGDTFDRADNTDLNASNSGKTYNGGAGTWSWTDVTGNGEILGNNLDVTSVDTQQFTRCEQDLSSDDHEAALVTGWSSIGTHRAFALTRFSPSVETCYTAVAQEHVSVANMSMRVAGTPTELGEVTGVTWVNDDVLKGVVSGSTVGVYKNGSMLAEVTDTTITGNLRVGVGLQSNAQARAYAQSWTAQDLLAPPTGLTIDTQPGQNVLDWTDAAGGHDVRIYRSAMRRNPETLRRNN
jgi:hypothetical protein